MYSTITSITSRLCQNVSFGSEQNFVTKLFDGYEPHTKGKFQLVDRVDVCDHAS